MSFISSSDKPILTCRLPYFADFDIKSVLLGQSSFEWIAYFKLGIVYFKPISKFAIVTCSWMFQFYTSKVLGKRYKISHLKLAIRY